MSVNAWFRHSSTFTRYRTLSQNYNWRAMRRSRLATFALLVAHAVASQKIPTAITGINLGGGSSNSCPVLVTGVTAGSPADRAGIKSGDVLVAVDGSNVATFDEAAKMLHRNSDTETPITLRLMRGEQPYTATVRRETMSVLLARAGNKLLDIESGMIVPLDATEAEMRGKIKTLSQDRFVERVFPAHYPTNEKLYYAGFETLILKNPAQVVVLGIEDGPASRAGIHWGDTILSINGIDPRNKSVADLEKLLSSDNPSSMKLAIERGGSTKTYVVQLEQTAQVLRDNGTQLVRGNPLPAGIPDKYLSCFLAKSE